MSSAQKIIQAAAGNAAGEALYVEDVFSTYLYEGNGSTQTITNGIDLDGEGGLVWIKDRDSGAKGHALFDTARGVNKKLQSQSTNGEFSSANQLTAFNSDGFDLGSAGDPNGSGTLYASWTFRKAPKFFDVVTYTGNGTAGHTISHNLGSVPGCIIVKNLDTSNLWAVYHRGLDVNGDSAPQTDYLRLNQDNAGADYIGAWNDTAPTDTHFTVGNDGFVNNSGDGFVAYLFAHNDGDGEFGENADQDIIKCGSIDLNSGSDTEVDLGFEPQWLLYKVTNNSGENWRILDNMRGGTADSGDTYLDANTSNAEATANVGFKFTSTGFIKTNEGVNYDYIYIAIRRGPMKTPEDATEVFNVLTYTGDNTDKQFTVGFPPDLWGNLTRNNTQSPFTGQVQGTRLTGSSYRSTGSTAADDTFGVISDYFRFDNMTGMKLRDYQNLNTSGRTYVSHVFRRAPGFFDVVAYEGNGTAGRTVSHNLGVVPEIVIIKQRSSSGNSWRTFHKDLSSGNAIFLNSTNPEQSENSRVSAVADTTFTLNDGTSGSNGSGEDYIAYLFATLPGISKVGSYTGDGTTDGSKIIDCGFSAGARFVLIKSTTRSTSDWLVADTERGIVAGNDPFLKLNATDAEITTSDVFDPASSGFAVNDIGTGFNNPGDEYIFLAIA